MDSFKNSGDGVGKYLRKQPSYKEKDCCVCSKVRQGMVTMKGVQEHHMLNVMEVSTEGTFLCICVQYCDMTVNRIV
jgi:hypothetical protein